jgi:hypothetical protein
VVSRLEPARPVLAATPAGPVPPGPATLALAGAPANGLAAFLMTAAAPGAERIVATIEGVPLWLGLPAAAPLAVLLTGTNAQGGAAVGITNPGGYGLALTLQVAALGAPGSAAFGSTAPAILLLEP